MKISILILPISLVLFGCSNHDHEDPANAHSHDQEMEGLQRKTAAITVYSPNHEVFTEHDLLVKGEASNFLIHVTRLDEDYSAFANGTVEVMLKANGKLQKGIAEKNDVAGIYQLTMIPEQAGEALIYFIVQSEEGSDTLTYMSHIFNHLKETAHIEEESSASLIRFTKEQAWKSRFNVTVIKPEAFTNVIKTSGEFTAVPGEKQFVTAKTEGIVLFFNKKMVQGMYVKKGEVLFTLSGEGLADNNITTRYALARTDFEKSKSDMTRHKTLLNEKIISEKQFLETQSRYLNDSIKYFTLKKTFSGSGLKVISPMDGYLHEMTVSEGQFVQPGELLVTISTNHIILLRADVPQQYYPMLAKVNTTHFRPAYSEKVYTLEELSGKLMSRGASVAENNHYLPVYFEVINDGTLLEGAYAEFFLKTDLEPGQKVIPVSALIEEQGNYYVYVQVSGEEFEKRAILLSANDGIRASVSSGLEFGERIISEGAMLVKSASSASIPSHSHSH